MFIRVSNDRVSAADAHGGTSQRCYDAPLLVGAGQL
jgi:hypothetical protein